MRHLLLFFILLAYFPATTFGADTTAYQTQRLKVNALLKQRSARFSQYDQSLDSRTGIFGMQTKEDVKKSNEILRQIVLNDNNIFKELKILMDYKDVELDRSQQEINRATSNAANLRSSIKKLQDENRQLDEQVSQQPVGGSLAWYIVALLGIAFLITIFRLRKPKKI